MRRFVPTWGESMLELEQESSPVTAPLWLRLSDATLFPDRVGGKCAQLAALLRSGFSVPDGAALTIDAFAQFIEHAQLGAELRLLHEALRPTAAVPSEEALMAARAKVRAAYLGEELETAIRNICARFPGPLAVRSSATAEDLGDASFAGLYETQLNVSGEDAVARAVRRCWSSLWQPRVIDYLRRSGIEEVPAMALLLQRLVPAEASGVVFTVNPTTGVDDEAVVEATIGLGEPLVSGRTDPDRYVVELWTGKLRSLQLGTKLVRATPAADGGLREEHLDGPVRPTRALDEEQLAKVVELAAQVQEHAGQPMDLEFAIADGQVHLLQARPITRIHFAPQLGEWTTANFREGGVAASESTALMCSLYERAFEESMPRYLESLSLIHRGHPAKWLRTFFGRPYWNFGEVKRLVHRTPGFVERNFDLDLGIPATYEGEGRATPISAGTVARSLPVVIGLERAYADVQRKIEAFVAAFPKRREQFELPREALRLLADDPFASGYRALLDGLHQATEALYFTTVYNLSNAKLELSISIDEAARRSTGPVRYSRLVGGLRDVSHLRPLRELHRLAAAKQDPHGDPVSDEEVRAFAGRWPHKGSRELDLRIPRWSEDLDEVRALVDQAVASYRADHDPDVIAERQHREYLAERERTLAVLPWYSRWLFVRRLERVRRLSWWREELRDCSTFTYHLVRQWTLEAGRRLAAVDALESPLDAFHLRAEELLSALEGRASAEETRAQAIRSRRMTRGVRHFEAPRELGARYPHGAAPRIAKAQLARRAVGALLQGTASSSGVIEGFVRVVRSMPEAHALQPGEILVAPFTDPGWVPALARCAAVITETGGLLSHAAVIAREYGIPAVLAVPEATQRIRTGQRVRIDGDAGTIEVLA